MSVLLLVPTIVRSITAWRETWETALTTVATAPAVMVVIGDSITEGQGASSAANRWTAKVKDHLLTRYPTGVPGGEGYRGAGYWTYAPDSTWTPHASTSGTVTNISTVGNLGMKTASLGASGSRTYDVVGTSADIWWQRSGSGGTFTWAVDGGGTTAVVTSGATSSTTRTTISLGAAGAHSITIARTAGTVNLEGFTIYNGDETKGTRVFEAGRTGWDTNEYLNHADYAGFIACITDLAPDLVLIELGGNDYMHNTVTPAGVQTNIQKLLTSLDALPKRPSILIVDVYNFAPGVNNNGNTATQDQYRQSFLNLALADPDYRSYLDLSITMPIPDTSGLGLYVTDGIHPNDAGYTEIAAQVRYAILPWEQPGPQSGTATAEAQAYPYGSATYSETWTGADTDPWPQQWDISGATGSADILTNRGQLLTPATAYTASQYAYLADMTPILDCEVLLNVGFVGVTEQYFVISLRSDGAQDAGFPANGYYVSIYPNGTTYDVGRAVANTQTVLNQPAHTYTSGIRVNVRFKIAGSVISVRVWNADVAEPGTWNYSATDGSPYSVAGRLMLNGASGSAATARSITVDDLQIFTGGAPVAPEVLPSGRPALQAWYTALEYRDIMPARWVAIGDSFTEGQGASVKTQRWVDKVLATLRADYPTPGVTGGVGYLPSWMAVYGPDSVWTPYSARSGTVTNSPQTGSTTTPALGERTVTIAVGATQTYTFTGSALDVWWVGGGGNLTVAIDGGGATTIPTAGFTGGDHRNRFNLGSSAARSVVIGCTTATSTLSGIMAYDGDTDAGIVLYEASHTSWEAGFYVDNVGLDPLYGLIQPDVVTIALGGNDMLNGVPVATYKSQIQTMISRIRAVTTTKPPAIIVVVEYSPNGQTANWLPFRNASMEIVAADPSLGFLDLYAVMGTAGTSGNWRSDGIHPSDAGHTLAATTVSDYLTEVVAPTLARSRSIHVSSASSLVRSYSW